ncbi:hypothetical protein [Streptomyces sp. HUAS TT20]|uniref:hypothetical protein n=1 Tax=Streptomyces sp. HUAS TT20 TaxID=3447509 RepID=UPI00398750C7
MVRAPATGVGSCCRFAVGAAGQSAVARSGALGFRAAAVTAVMPVAGSGPPRYRYETTVVQVRSDRPFGFLAVHRETRLVLAADWVTDPTPFGSQGLRGAPAPGR